MCHEGYVYVCVQITVQILGAGSLFYRVDPEDETLFLVFFFGGAVLFCFVF